MLHFLTEGPPDEAGRGGVPRARQENPTFTVEGQIDFARALQPDRMTQEADGREPEVLHGGQNEQAARGSFGGPPDDCSPRIMFPRFAKNHALTPGNLRRKMMKTRARTKNNYIRVPRNASRRALGNATGASLVPYLSLSLAFAFCAQGWRLVCFAAVALLCERALHLLHLLPGRQPPINWLHSPDPRLIYGQPLATPQNHPGPSNTTPSPRRFQVSHAGFRGCLSWPIVLDPSQTGQPQPSAANSRPSGSSFFRSSSLFPMLPKPPPKPPPKLPPRPCSESGPAQKQIQTSVPANRF